MDGEDGLEIAKSGSLDWDVGNQISRSPREEIRMYNQ